MNSDALLDVVVYYGSTEGSTARVVDNLVSLCESLDLPWSIDLLDVAEFLLEDMPTFDLAVLAAPTWNTGQLQRDWERVFDEFDALDLTHTYVALLGLGDQAGYPDTFADALAFLSDKVQERGAVLVGRWPLGGDPAGYTFASSWALDGDAFVGLVIDEDNQPEATKPRLRLWLQRLADEIAQRQTARD